MTNTNKKIRAEIGNEEFISKMKNLCKLDFIESMRFQYGVEIIESFKASTGQEKTTKRFIVNLSKMDEVEQVRIAMNSILVETEITGFKVKFSTTLPRYTANHEGFIVDVYLNLRNEKEILSELAGCELVKNDYNYSSGGYSCKIGGK